MKVLTIIYLQNHRQITILLHTKCRSNKRQQGLCRHNISWNADYTLLKTITTHDYKDVIGHVCCFNIISLYINPWHQDFPYVNLVWTDIQLMLTSNTHQASRSDQTKFKLRHIIWPLLSNNIPCIRPMPDTKHILKTSSQCWHLQMNCGPFRRRWGTKEIEKPTRKANMNNLDI